MEKYQMIFRASRQEAFSLASPWRRSSGAGGHPAGRWEKQVLGEVRHQDAYCIPAVHKAAQGLYAVHSPGRSLPGPAVPAPRRSPCGPRRPAGAGEGPLPGDQGDVREALSTPAEGGQRLLESPWRPRQRPRGGWAQTAGQGCAGLISSTMAKRAGCPACARQAKPFLCCSQLALAAAGMVAVPHRKQRGIVNNLALSVCAASLPDG